MKKTFTSSFLGLAISGLLLASCSQMASYENEDLALEQARADKAGFTLSPYGSTGGENAALYEEGVCETKCIDPENPEYYVKPSTIINSNQAQSRVFAYRVYNTLTGFELEWDYTATNNAARKLRISVSGAGFSSPQTYISNVVQSNGSGSHTFDFDASWAACEVVTINAEILDGDNLVVTPAETTTYALIGECTVGCDEADFDYETLDNQNIVFSYNHGSDVESVTLAFTFPQVMNMPLNEDNQYEAPDGKIYDVNNTGNQTVLTWTGAVGCDADEPETFEFSMTPDCGKGKDGKANIWTDTKVVAINGVQLVDDLLTEDIDEGPYSLKGELTNIVYTGCSVNE